MAWDQKEITAYLVDVDTGASQMEAMIRDGISRPVKRYAMLPRDGTPAQVAEVLTEFAGRIEKEDATC